MKQYYLYFCLLTKWQIINKNYAIKKILIYANSLI